MPSHFIQPLKLGNKIFPNNLIQGPLAGISCAPFRKLTWQYSKPAFSCTEMISCKTLIHERKFAEQRFIRKDSAEGALCVQLSGNQPNELAIATQYATESGADLIDLNCGCPVKKIRGRGAGSSLLTNANRLYALIRAMKTNTHLPVSIKIRVEGSGNEKFHQELVKAISDAETDYLIVHGRHWTEHYETPCHHDNIQFFVENLKIPVIGNGDITDLESLNTMFKTGCAGVMIGRSGVGQPWLIRQLMAEMHDEKFTAPSNAEIKSLFLQHVAQLAEMLGNEKFAILQSRKFAKYYARTLPNRNEFSQEVNQCDAFEKLKAICAKYFACTSPQDFL